MRRLLLLLLFVVPCFLFRHAVLLTLCSFFSFGIFSSSLLLLFWLFRVLLLPDGVKYPQQMAGKVISVIAAVFGTFFLSMPLTIVGGEFHTIYSGFRKEQEAQEAAIHRALKSGVTEKISDEMKKVKVLHSAASNLNLAFSMRKFAKKIKRKTVEKHLSSSDQTVLTKYVTAVHELPTTHDVVTLQEFDNLHKIVCCILVCHFSHHRDMIRPVGVQEIRFTAESEEKAEIQRNDVLAEKKKVVTQAKAGVRKRQQDEAKEMEDEFANADVEEAAEEERGEEEEEEEEKEEKKEVEKIEERMTASDIVTWGEPNPMSTRT